MYQHLLLLNKHNNNTLIIKLENIETEELLLVDIDLDLFIEYGISNISLLLNHNVIIK